MTAVTRWVQYDVAEAGVFGTGGGIIRGRGTRGYSFPTSSVGDSFNIGTTNNRLYIKADGLPSTPYGLTLASGTDLDPRFVAKDITEKMHNAGQATTAWDQAQCVWEGNEFKLYSGTLNTNSTMTVWSGTNTAHLELGWGGSTENAGSDHGNGDGDNYITVSGVYNGFFDEIYRIVINKEVGIQTPSKDGGNEYTGTFTTGGAYNNVNLIVYTMSISTTNGTTMGAGTGNVPTMSWESTLNADDGGPVELLYADYWYKVGVRGLMVKFSDGIFNTIDPAWTITCNAVQYAEGSNADVPVGTAKFIWSSNRGDDADTAYDTSDDYVRLGTRGMSVKWATGFGNLQAGDQFWVICTPPQPSSYNITNLNYGNVTVTLNIMEKVTMILILDLVQWAPEIILVSILRTVTNGKLMLQHQILVI